MQKLARELREWLGEEGVEFFREVYDEHGTLHAVWMEGSIPHPVHFREGMQVRNFLRRSGFCDDWGAHDFDARWEGLVLEAIGE